MKCPACNSADGIRKIVYGLPDGPLDEEKFVIGGCCITDEYPTRKCIRCGWKGRNIKRNLGLGNEIKVVELQDISTMSIPRDEKLRITQRVHAKWSQTFGDRDDAEANDAYYSMLQEAMAQAEEKYKLGE